MKKRILAVFLALVLCLGLLPVVSHAADVSYAVTGGNISFDPATGTITGCEDSVTAADIPSAIYGVPVTTIGKQAFFRKTNLTSVTIPNSVTSIEYEAFGRSGLTSVTVPGSVKSLGQNTFYFCKNLTSVTLQDGVSLVGYGMFDQCSNLETVSLPATLKKIDVSAFSGTNLRGVTIPSSVTEMEIDAFYNCGGLTSIIIPGSISEISVSSFKFCDNLKTVVIQDGVKKIDSSAFGQCKKLESITLPDSLVSIGSNAFSGCPALKEVSFGAGLEEIGNSAFWGDTSLTAVGFSTGLKKIDREAFHGCTALADVYYTGDVIAWSAIELGKSNEPLSTANFHFNAKFTPAQSSTPATPTTPSTPDTPDTPANPGQTFTDVPADAYYAEAVQWAVDNGVTTGTTATTFSPNDTVTRGQAVTFLWRAVGKPAPKSTVCPFTDVKTGDYYYQPVLWAMEQGVTNGTDATHFSPDATLTRAHIVTFLWRTAGRPDSTGASLWYEDAVSWGRKNDLLSGTAVAFTPDGSCPRADVVTYLYRADQKGVADTAGKDRL